MKYPYMVFDGKRLYKAGEEVPEAEEKVTEQPKQEEKPVRKRRSTKASK